MVLSNLYLITGVFFQEQVGIALGYPNTGGDLTAVVRSGIGQFLYSGVLWRDPNQLLGSYAGTMLDELGHARLENVVITEVEFRFDKLYENGRPHDKRIQYTFRRRSDSEWHGQYSFVESNVQGPTRCMLLPTTEEFFRHNLTPTALRTG